MSTNGFEELNPPPRRLMGPGPVDVDPRVLRAMSTPLLGQFDPVFTEYMNQVMSLYRQVFRTDHPGVAQHESPFQDIFQFPHVAGKIAGHQQAHRLLG